MLLGQIDFFLNFGKPKFTKVLICSKMIFSQVYQVYQNAKNPNSALPWAIESQWEEEECSMGDYKNGRDFSEYRIS